MESNEHSSLPTAVQEFRPRCPGCTTEVVTAEEAKPCSHYDCPGLPKELEVTCNKCMYDFAAQDGQPDCDHSTCKDALRLQSNVDTYRDWQKLLAEETAGNA